MTRHKRSSRPISKVRKTVAERYLSRKRVFPFLFVITLIMFACAHVWQQVYTLELATEVRGMEKENSTLNDLLKKRRAEIVELTRLSVIERVASEKANLHRTASENLFTLIRDDSYRDTDGIDNLISALKKVADNMPVVNETHAESKDFFDFDEK